MDWIYQDAIERMRSGMVVAYRQDGLAKLHDGEKLLKDLRRRYKRHFGGVQFAPRENVNLIEGLETNSAELQDWISVANKIIDAQLLTDEELCWYLRTNLTGLLHSRGILEELPGNVITARISETEIPFPTRKAGISTKMLSRIQKILRDAAYDNPTDYAAFARLMRNYAGAVLLPVLSDLARRYGIERIVVSDYLAESLWHYGPLEVVKPDGSSGLWMPRYEATAEKQMLHLPAPIVVLKWPPLEAKDGTIFGGECVGLSKEIVCNLAEDCDLREALGGIAFCDLTDEGFSPESAFLWFYVPDSQNVTYPVDPIFFGSHDELAPVDTESVGKEFGTEAPPQQVGKMISALLYLLNDRAGALVTRTLDESTEHPDEPEVPTEHREISVPQRTIVIGDFRDRESQSSILSRGYSARYQYEVLRHRKRNPRVKPEDDLYQYGELCAQDLPLGMDYPSYLDRFSDCMKEYAAPRKFANKWIERSLCSAWWYDWEHPFYFDPSRDSYDERDSFERELGIRCRSDEHMHDVSSYMAGPADAPIVRPEQRFAKLPDIKRPLRPPIPERTRTSPKKRRRPKRH